MNKRSILLAGVAIFLCATEKPIYAKNIPWEIKYNPQNQHKYFTTNQSANVFYGPFSGGWDLAQSSAVSSRSRLVTIDNANEQNWLVQNFGSNELFWTGLNDSFREGRFRWVSNNSIPRYTNWFPGEPNDAFSNEDYVVMNWAGAPGKWNDLLGGGTNPTGFNVNSIKGIAEFSGLPASRRTSSLLFQDIGEKKIPGLDHVGLLFDRYVYESTPGQQDGLYWNPEVKRYEPVDQVSGVQKERSRGVFKAFPSSKNREVPISRNLASRMAKLINNKVRNAGYQELSAEGILKGNYLPWMQKGWNNKFTCVGLIEWAAEQVGYRGGQGFIPSSQEKIFGKIATITPEIMYWAVTAPDLFFNPGNFLHGLLDPVDFILTDSLGRRLGYTAELGLLNEIPGAYYTGDDWAEQFYIPHLPSGNYALDLFGLDDEVNLAIGNTDVGVSYSGFLKKGETHNLSFFLPESTLSSTFYPEEDWVTGYDPEGEWIDRTPESYLEDDWSEWEKEAKSVPESSSIFGIFILGGLGISSWLKQYLQQKPC